MPVRKPDWPVMNEMLTVVVGEHHAFLGDAVDIGRLVAHQAARIDTDIGLADVVAPDDDDIWLLLCGRRRTHRDDSNEQCHQSNR